MYKQHFYVANIGKHYSKEGYATLHLCLWFFCSPYAYKINVTLNYINLFGIYLVFFYDFAQRNTN